MKSYWPTLCLILICSCVTTVYAQKKEGEIDPQKVQDLREKRRQGKVLTPEEAAYLQRAIEERKKFIEAFKQAHPPRDSTGLVALIDLGKGVYKDQEGGLYPGGENVPPAAHLKAGLKLAGQIVPLDGEGRPSKDGKIVFVSIGMSNTTQEFQAFERLAEADPEINPYLVIVDGAQGGQSAEVTVNPNANFWRVIDERLTRAGVTPRQVQTAWIKQAIQLPNRPFPEEVKVLQGHLLTNLHILADRFPNLKMAYLSSRIYGGYAEAPLNPEPHAYESGFAVKWLIVDQIAGKSELNDDPEKGTVRSPWLAWGPYLWADGARGRSDGLTYLRKDLADDGTHPSVSGREKVAAQLLAFLKSDPTARLWFVKK